MGFAGVLVDRARCLRQVRSGARVEGRPQLENVRSEWFRCRLEPAQSTEVSDEGHHVRVARTWLICGKKDIKGDPVKLLATDYIQILSDDVDVGEDMVWAIRGDVVPMRRRKGTLGFEFQVEQVREAPTWAQTMLSR